VSSYLLSVLQCQGLDVALILILLVHIVVDRVSVLAFIVSAIVLVFGVHSNRSPRVASTHVAIVGSGVRLVLVRDVIGALVFLLNIGRSVVSADGGSCRCRPSELLRSSSVSRAATGTGRSCGGMSVRARRLWPSRTWDGSTGCTRGHPDGRGSAIRGRDGLGGRWLMLVLDGRVGGSRV